MSWGPPAVQGLICAAAPIAVDGLLLTCDFVVEVLV